MFSFFKKKIVDEPLEEQIEEIPEFMLGHNLLAENCDQLPNSIDEFGRIHTNPIPVNGFGGEIKYLNRLRCNCGVGLMSHRLGPIEVDGIKEAVNVFETVRFKGKDWHEKQGYRRRLLNA